TAGTVGLRVATYNVHKCRGMDGRVRPDRVAEVLSEIDADIVALQEVVCLEGKRREEHQAQYIAEELGYHAELGENRVIAQFLRNVLRRNWAITRNSAKTGST